MRTRMLIGVLMGTCLLLGSHNSFATEFGKTHKDAGVECVSCHGQDKKAVIPNQNCLTCHESYDALAEQTKDMHLNPHWSPHFLNLECTSCHQGHKTLDNFCQKCHGPIKRH